VVGVGLLWLRFCKRTLNTTNPETEDQSLDSESAAINIINARVDELICAMLHDKLLFWQPVRLTSSYNNVPVLQLQSAEI